MASKPPTFTDLTGDGISRTLVRKLVPTVDKLRDLNTKFGVRPYVVHVIRTRWTGGERGIGQEVVVQDVALLPTPKVTDLTGLTLQIQQIGAIEAGSVRVSEMS